LLLLALDASAAEWRVDQARSKLGFVATYEKIAFEGWFKKFTARISFDPSALSKASFKVSIAISSVDSDSRDRDEGMQGAEWFDTKTYPDAEFVTTGFEKTGSDTFAAHGKLTIKGTTQTITLPFSWKDQGQAAQLTAELPLTRTDFNIGTGEWEKDPTIGFGVKVLVDLYLLKQ